MDTLRLCENCGKPLAGDAPQGLCPACLLKAGLVTEPGDESMGRTAFVPPPVEVIAKLFPQLEVLGWLGQGGMGTVYKARQLGLDRLVALKILPPRSRNEADFAERFTREARALARLSHPHIVAVYDFGQVSLEGASAPAAAAAHLSPATSLHYFLMEYVDGPNLRQLERVGKLAPEEVLRIIPQICEALQYAHSEGIVHRDIKPENVLLDRKGRVKIADFGLAKILDEKAASPRLTVQGQLMGTPHYMAPEQVEHPQPVDHRADIYSLGVVVYEMLTGELPLGKFAPPSARLQGVLVDVRLDEVVLRALEKEPERRYQTAGQVKSAVEAITNHAELGSPPPTAAVPLPAAPHMAQRRPFAKQLWPWAAAVLVLALAVLALWKPFGHRASGPPVIRTFTAADKPIAADLVPAGNNGWMVTCSGPKTLALFEVANPGVEQCRVTYQAQLKSEGFTGQAYLEMWCEFPNSGQFFSRGLQNPLVGTNDWATYQTPFFLKTGERPNLLKLNLVVEGQGKVFIRDVRVFASPWNANNQNAATPK
jgi:predicted Ser/Thr protein kinase